MTNKGWSYVLLTVIFLSFTAGCQEKEITIWPESKLEEKPNIVWLVCEDQSSKFFPMYGDKTIDMPILNSLADNAVIYENAFTPAPVCAPARSSIITGMYQTTLGTHNMRTYNRNKEENQPTIGVPIYSPVVPENVKVFTNYLRANGYYCTNNAKEDYNFETPLGTWDDSSNKASYRNRPENTPFFAIYNYGITHESQVWKQGDNELFVDPDRLEVPPFFPDTPEIRHDLAVNYSNLKRLDDQLAKVIDQLKEDGLYENTYIFFYSDHGGPFPRHKRSVYDTGLKVPMIIKLPGNKSAGVRNDSFISFIDLAPTVLSIAGIKPPVNMQGKAKLGIFKAEQEDDFVYAASDRFDECYDKKRVVRSKKFKYIKNYITAAPYKLPVSYRMQMPMMKKMAEMDSLNELRGSQKLWFTKQKPEEELYDLELDPNELINLAAIPEFANLINVFRVTLEAWEVSTADLGRFSEKELIEKWVPAARLEAPTIQLHRGKVHLTTNHTDATLLWRIKGSDTWQIYVGSIVLQADEIIETVAIRIGYEASPIRSTAD